MGFVVAPRRYGKAVSHDVLTQLHRRTTVSALGSLLLTKGAFVLALALTVDGFPMQELLFFDAGWYLGIVTDGYSYDGTSEDAQSNLAFFPLLPMLARALTWLGIAPPVALLAVAWAGAIAAVVLIARLGDRVGGPGAGGWLALMWCVAPRSHVQVMGYTEGLFTALAAGFLLALLSRKWWWAGALAALAGLTRATALTMVATLGIAAVVEIVQRVRGRKESAPVLTVIGATMLGGLGFLGYWFYVALRTGNALGYLNVQAQWNSTTGSPLTTLQTMVQVLLSPQDDPAANRAIAWVVLAYLILFVWMLVRQEQWQLTLYVAFGMAVVFMQAEYFNSKARLLLPLFPVLLPLARLLASAPRWVSWPLALLAIIGSVVWSVEVAAYYPWSP